MIYDYSLGKVINSRILHNIFETYPQRPQGYPHFLWKCYSARNTSYLADFMMRKPDYLIKIFLNFLIYSF